MGGGGGGGTTRAGDGGGAGKGGGGAGTGGGCGGWFCGLESVSILFSHAFFASSCAFATSSASTAGGGDGDGIMGVRGGSGGGGVIIGAGGVGSEDVGCGIVGAVVCWSDLGDAVFAIQAAFAIAASWFALIVATSNGALLSPSKLVAGDDGEAACV